MNFTKINISDIPVEEAHGGSSGSRQVLVKPEFVTSEYLEAVTKGFLKPGGVFDWHTHQDTDETFIVLKGEGKFYCGEGGCGIQRRRCGYYPRKSKS